MRRACRLAVAIYVAACVVALAFIPLSAAGIIARDPLAGVFAVILAMPWTLLTASLASPTSTAANITLAAGGMALNALLLAGLCHLFRR